MKELKEKWIALLDSSKSDNEFLFNLNDVYQFAFDCIEDAIIVLKVEIDMDGELLYRECRDYIADDNGDYLFSKLGLEWFIAGNNRAIFEIYRQKMDGGQA